MPYFLIQRFFRLYRLLPIKPLRIVPTWCVVVTHNSLMVMMVVNRWPQLGEILHHLLLRQNVKFVFEIGRPKSLSGSWILKLLLLKYLFEVTASVFRNVYKTIIDALILILILVLVITLLNILVFALELLTMGLWNFIGALHIGNCLVHSFPQSDWVGGRYRVIRCRVHSYHMVSRFNTIRPYILKKLLFLIPSMAWLVLIRVVKV
jgi:hypothetical protein